jgi:hypothetical protein
MKKATKTTMRLTSSSTINVVSNGTVRLDIHDGNVSGLSILDSSIDSLIYIEDSTAMTPVIMNDDTNATAAINTVDTNANESNAKATTTNTDKDPVVIDLINEPTLNTTAATSNNTDIAQVVIDLCNESTLNTIAPVVAEDAVEVMTRWNLLSPTEPTSSEEQLDERLRMLTLKETKELEKYCNDAALCASVANKAAATSVKFHCRLADRVMIMDEEINAYSALVQEYHRKEKCNHPSAERIVVRDSYFLTKLLGMDTRNDEAKYNFHDRTFKYSAHYGSSFVGVDKIYITINDHLHWTLAVIIISENKIIYYDSLLGGHRVFDKKIRRILLQYVKDVLEWYHMRAEEFEFIVDETFPQQDGGLDCGAYMCMALDILSAGLKMPTYISVETIINYRKRMQLSILKGEVLYPLRIEREGYFQGFANLPMQKNGYLDGCGPIDFSIAAMKQFVMPKMIDRVKKGLVTNFHHSGVGGAAEDYNIMLAIYECCGEEIYKDIIVISTELYPDATCLQNCATILREHPTISYQNFILLMGFDEMNYVYPSDEEFNRKTFYYSICTAGPLFYYTALLRAFIAKVSHFMVSYRWIEALGPGFTETVGVDIILGPKLKGGGTYLCLGYFQILDEDLRETLIGYVILSILFIFGCILNLSFMSYQ